MIGRHILGTAPSSVVPPSINAHSECSARSERPRTAHATEAVIGYTIEGERHFRAPPAAVDDVLHDPGVLRRALPGSATLVARDRDAYDLRAPFDAGPISGEAEGNIELHPGEGPGHYRLLAEARAAPGGARGEATITLSSDAPGTLLRYSGEFELHGLISRLGSGRATRAAHAIAERLLDAMEAELTERSAEEAP
jgi:carbon monoxide dehydrogenase subunit G